MKVPGVPYVEGRNDYRDRDGRKYGMAIHNTSNDASDEGEANYARRRDDGTSSHFYVDDDSVTQSLDTDVAAGHAGSDEGNQHAVAYEITGANGWSRERWLRSVAWAKLGRAIAWQIRNDLDFRGFQVRRASVAEMKRNPRVQAFYGHDDMRRAWGGTRHTDPGPSFPWDRLFQAVNDALTGAGEDDGMTDINLDQVVYTAAAGNTAGVPAGPRTWKAIIQALDSRTVGLKADLVTALGAVEGRLNTKLQALVDDNDSPMDDATRAALVAEFRVAADEAVAAIDVPSAEENAEATVDEMHERTAPAA